MTRAKTLKLLKCRKNVMRLEDMGFRKMKTKLNLTENEQMPNNISLSVLLVTYNHRDYIEAALESVLMQEININFEIVIADDASTDDTRVVAENYLKSHGFKNYRFLEFGKNLGITKNYQRSFYSISSDYVAIIEGDDFWVCRDKLAKQVKYLDENRFAVGCANNYYVKLEGQGTWYPRHPIVDGGFTLLSGAELIADNLIGNFSTCMYRTSALKTIPSELFENRSYDWIINITLMVQGPIIFLHQIMSVYRVHSKGAWSGMSEVEKLKSQLEQIPLYNHLSGKVFDNAWTQLSDSLSLRIDNIENGNLPKPVPYKRNFLSKVFTKLYIFAPKPILNLIKTITPARIRNRIRNVSNAK